MSIFETGWPPVSPTPPPKSATPTPEPAPTISIASSAPKKSTAPSTVNKGQIWGGTVYTQKSPATPVTTDPISTTLHVGGSYNGSASTGGSYTLPDGWGTISGNVFLGTTASGNITIGPDGANINGSFFSGEQASGTWNTTTTIDGVTITNGVTVTEKIGVGASFNDAVGSNGVDLSFSAFAGTSIGVSDTESVSTGGVTVTGTVGVSAGEKVGISGGIIAEQNPNGTVTLGGALGGSLMMGGEVGGAITFDPGSILAPGAPTLDQINSMKTKLAQYQATISVLNAEVTLINTITNNIYNGLIPSSTWENKIVVIRPGYERPVGWGSGKMQWVPPAEIHTSVRPTQEQYEAALAKIDPTNSWHLGSYLMLMQKVASQASSQSAAISQAASQLEASIKSAVASRNAELSITDRTINTIVTGTKSVINTVKTGATNTWNTVSQGAQNVGNTISSWFS